MYPNPEILEQIRAKAAADARQTFEGDDEHPVDMLSAKLKETMHDVKPYWLHEVKRRPDESPVNWGPDTNLYAGGAGDRSSHFSTAMRSAMGGS